MQQMWSDVGFMFLSHSGCCMTGEALGTDERKFCFGSPKKQFFKLIFVFFFSFQFVRYALEKTVL